MGVPRRIGDIQVYAEIGQGPLSIVCRGYEQKRDRFVLLKILRREAMLDEGIIERFEEEARLAARIEHENVVAVYGFGREGEQAYIATEYVDGTDLANLISRGRVPEELAVFILLEISRGLEAAHEERVLHRDLKPSNVMVGNDGTVKLTDFGFASLIGDPQDEIRGTASYLTPEQLRGEPFTPASDLFALGAVFFEMLLGRPAFLGGSTSEIVDSILNDDPVEALEHLPGISRESRLICRKLMAKQPAERIPSAGDTVRELEAVADPATTSETLQAYLVSPDSFRSTRQLAENGSPDDPPETRPLEKRVTHAGLHGRSKPRRPRRSVFAAGIAVMAVAAAYFIWGTTSPQGPPSENESENQPFATPPTAIEQTSSKLDEEDPEAGTNSVGGADRRPPMDSVPGAISGQDSDATGGNGSADLEHARLVAADSATTGPASADSAGAGTALADPASVSLVPTDSSSLAGRLTVDSVPWAILYVDDDSVSMTPLRAPIPLTPGEHSIALRNPDFPVYRQQITVGAGESVDVSVSLYSLVGQILFEISPWAEVSIDGAVRDTIPPQEHPLLLAGGEYALRLRHPSLGVWETSLLVVPGETRRLRFNLFELLSQ